MPHLYRFLLVLAVLALLLGIITGVSAQEGTGYRLAADWTRIQSIALAQNAWVSSPALSANGSQLVFAASAALVSDDTDGTADIYLYDSETGLQRLTAGEAEANRSGAYTPVISTDGRLVAFTATEVFSNEERSFARGQVYVQDLSSGRTTRISSNLEGEPAQGWSSHPSISADGRWIAFTSLANDLVENDHNPGADIFLYDRRSSQNRLVSLAPGGEQAPGWSLYPALSADGRFAAFINIDPSHSDHPALLVHDLLRNHTFSLRDLPGAPAETGLRTPAISADGSLIVFAGMPEENGPAGIYYYARDGGQISFIPGSLADQPAQLRYGLSPDGRFIAYTIAGQETALIQVYDRQEDSLSPLLALPPGASLPPGSDRLALSAHASSLAFATSGSGAGMYLSNGQGSGEPQRSLSGWIADTQGYPLAEVELSNGYGRITESDRNGLFRFDSLRSGVYTITPYKEGYTFTPESREIRASDLIWPSISTTFSPIPEDILAEARLDLGMPYSTNRGCETPWEGCGGPFHGFYAGDCTDLILDAFNEGAGFNIQHALERHLRRHPEHYYRWRDVRSAQDMWRYFAYTGQMLAPEDPYLPGDLVFLDWEEDGVVDHVAMISEVTPSGKPKRMLDATGVIDDNPEGLATELEWKSYHRNHTVGHARWNGSFSSPGSSTASGQFQLLAAIDSHYVRLRLLDSQAREISASAITLENGSYTRLDFSEALSLFVDNRQEEIFFLELGYPPAGDNTPAAAPYQLGIQAATGGWMYQNESVRSTLNAGETLLIPVQLYTEDGHLRFIAELP